MQHEYDTKIKGCILQYLVSSQSPRPYEFIRSHIKLKAFRPETLVYALCDMEKEELIHTDCHGGWYPTSKGRALFLNGGEE